MRPFLLAVVTLLAVGCGSRGPAQSTRSSLPQATNARIHRFDIDNYFAYVVDTTTETCFLQQRSAWGYGLVLVECDKLAAKVPEAARVITWVAAPATPPPAAP